MEGHRRRDAYAHPPVVAVVQELAMPAEMIAQDGQKTRIDEHGRLQE